MKRMFFTVLAMSMILTLTGCGGGGGSSPPPPVVAQILSHPAFDGDIELDSSNTLTVTQGTTSSVFAGIDPVTTSEFRAFLDFPLTGVIPGSAFIDSATLDIFIDSIRLTGSSIPIRIELVSFTPPTLVPTDFDRALQPSLATVTTTIFPSDLAHHVVVDVTPLMVEAQRRGLVNFQIRILEDLGPVFPGIFEIDDTTNTRAPLLEVTYS
jgi:predicted small lipoprotein YifL